MKENLDREIADLQVTIVKLHDEENEENVLVLEITHEVYITAVDGKCLQNMHGKTAMSRCPFCTCTPLEMSDINNIESEKFKPNPRLLIHGISALHARVQSFNHLKNIAARQFRPNPQWTTHEKYREKFDRKMKKIQNDFFEKLGLRVDFPNSKGGTSTNGNVSRRAFENDEITAEILNLDPQLVKNFKIILAVISCKNFIRTTEFQKLCSDTYRLLLTKYKWVHVCPTVHKILAHSAEVAESLPLPLGMFGEEGSESCNKIYRNDREDHARKTSRSDNIKDVFNRAMDTSDPFIAHQASKIEKNKNHEISPETMSQFTMSDEEIQRFYQENVLDDDEN